MEDGRAVSEGSVNPCEDRGYTNFRETCLAEVPRTPLLGTSVNKGEEKGRGRRRGGAYRG
jgi:hypothetical protein